MSSKTVAGMRAWTKRQRLQRKKAHKALRKKYRIKKELDCL